jgi:pimeloyl-ACP methyl ester carboxylesterase
MGGTDSSVHIRGVSRDRVRPPSWGRTVDGPDAGQTWTQTGDLLLLVNHLRLERFHLIATVLGGYVGYDFALSYPERLRSAVIANSVGGFQDEQLVALQERLRPSRLSEMLADFIELGPAYRASSPAGVQRWLERDKKSRHSAKSGTPLQHRLTLGLLEAIQTPMLLLTAALTSSHLPPFRT